MKLNSKDTKLFDSLADSRQLCKCGHSIIFHPETQFTICSYCGRKVVNTTKARYRLEILRRLNENNVNDNGNNNVSRYTCNFKTCNN